MSEGHRGKVAVVTGAARGIGRAIALRLACAGADVALLDIDLKGAKRWKAPLTAASVPDGIPALGRRSLSVKTKLGDRTSATDAGNRIPLRRYGAPDDIFKAVDLLTGELPDFVTGQVISSERSGEPAPC